MKTKTPSHISQVIGRLKAVWSEMDYAQRRLFEIRTGVAVDDVLHERRARRTAKELEAAYSSDEPWLADERWLAEEPPAA